MIQNTWFELAMSLSCCLGLHLYATNGAPSQMWQCLQPGRKVVTYCATAPTAKPDLGFSSMLGGCCSQEPTQGHQKCGRGCTGTLNGLVGSHTRLVIYPSLTICCQRVVICASLDTRFKGMQVVIYPANIKQLKSH